MNRSPYTYLLKKRTKQPLEEYVSGNMRFYFIKHAVVDKEEDSTPIIYEQRRQLIPDHTKSKSPTLKLTMGENQSPSPMSNFKTVNINGYQMVEVVTATRNLGWQTLMREREDQTITDTFTRFK